MQKLAITFSILFLLTVSANAQMSREADTVCRAECADYPKVVMFIPPGEPPILSPVYTRKGLEWVDLRVHSATDSNEWFCRFPANYAYEWFGHWGLSIPYGCQAQSCLSPMAYGALGVEQMTLKELSLRSILELPGPVLENGQYVLNCAWEQRDSGLKPQSQKSSQTDEVDEEFEIIEPDRSKLAPRCASCQKWWQWRMQVDPTSWKYEEVILTTSSDFPQLSGPPANRD